MVTLYLAVVLSGGQIKGTLGQGLYTNPQDCFVMTKMPRSSSDEEYKCMKVQGNFVDFQIIEKIK